MNSTVTLAAKEDTLFKLKSPQNIMSYITSHYPTDLDAFYELIKNIEDQNAREIFTEVDYINKRVILFGNGIGADDKELVRIQRNAGKSIKDLSHHGVGLYCFIRLASRLIFITKKDKQHYIMSMAPHPGGEEIYSDVGAPHQMSKSEKATYSNYIGKINRYSDGTVYILEDVGCESTSKTFISSKFDIEKVFSKKNYIDFLRGKCNHSLKSIKFFFKVSASSNQERIDPKVGPGKSHKFSVPSKKCPYPKEKTAFFNMGREFELSLECEFSISNMNNGDIIITENHKNALPIDKAFGNCQKLNYKDSIFRGDPLGQYLNGEISFSVFAKDGGETPSNYAGARSCLLLNNSFGDTISNMITAVDRNVMRPLLLDFAEKQHNKINKKLNKKYEDLVNGFFDEYSFEELLVQSTGPVIDIPNKRKCPRCNRKLDFSIVDVLPDLKFKINKIYLCKSQYTCGMCRSTWTKEQRHSDSEKRKVPIYKSPNPHESTDRKKKHGLGVSINMVPLEKADNRKSMYVKPSTVIINTNHPDYKALNKSTSMAKVLEVRNMSLIFSEIIKFRMKEDAEKHLDQLNEMLSKFSIWLSKERGKYNRDKQ